MLCSSASSAPQSLAAAGTDVLVGANLPTWMEKKKALLRLKLIVLTGCTIWLVFVIVTHSKGVNDNGEE